MPRSGGSKRKKAVFYTHRDLTWDYYQPVIEKDRPKWCKLLWLLITMALLATTIYLVVKLVKSYTEFSSYNKVSVKWQKSLALPAITICSTNFINYTDFNEIVTDTAIVEDFGELLVEIENYNGKGGIVESIDNYKSKAEKFDFNLKDKDGGDVSIFGNFQVDPARFILGDNDDHYQAKFGGVWMELDLNSGETDSGTESVTGRNVGSHKFGKCIVLNDDRSLVQVLGGPEGGFTIDLDGKVEDYLPTTKTKGFMVYLRNPNETLLINEGGILVSPGTETFIGLSKSEVTRLPPRFGKCKDVPSTFVPSISKSVRECLQEEKLKIAVEECGCVPWYLRERLDELKLTDYKNALYDLLEEAEGDEEVDRSKVCGFATQAVCDARVLEKLVKNLENNESTCPEPCYFEEYEWNINVGQFPPTKQYYALLLKNRVNVGDETEANFEYALENFVRIHIYYENIKVTKMKQDKAYEIFNFIAELGGTVDLMIGFSFFTLFQAFEILLVCACYRRCVRKKSKDGPDVVENPVNQSDVGNNPV